MEPSKDIFDNVTEKKNAVGTRMKNTVSDVFPMVILVANIILAIVLRLFSPTLENPFTPLFFISLVYNVLSTMFCYSFFTYYMESKEKSRLPGYAENCNVWERLSSQVRLNWCEQFIDYCILQVEIEREEKRKNIVANHTMITMSKYASQYRDLNKNQLKELFEKREISRREYFFLCRANGKINVKPINPLVILCGLSYNHPNDAGRKRIAYSTFSVLSRPVVMFAGSAAFAACKGTFIGLSSTSIIYEMLLSTVLIVSSSFMGCFAGAKSANIENDRIKSRIFFLERFKRTAETNPEALN